MNNNLKNENQSSEKYEIRTTKEIKKDLQDKFKKTKFSVTKGKGTALHWIYISWFDGPTMDQVKDVSAKYNDKKNDDSMTDLWCGSQYTSESRSFSVKAYMFGLRIVCDKIGLVYDQDMVQIKKNYKGKEYADLKNDIYFEETKTRLATLINKELCKIDFESIEDYGAESQLPEREICSRCKTIIDEEGYGELKNLCWDCYGPIYEEQKIEENKIAKEKSKKLKEYLKKVTPLSKENVERELIEIAFPKLNKNNTIDLYNEQLETKNYKLIPTKITKVVILDQEGYDIFVNNLLSNYEWMNGEGGCSSTFEKSYENCTNEEDVKNYYDNAFNLAIEVKAKNRMTLYVDPQGYGYARYVGFNINDKIKSNVVYLKDYLKK